MSRDILKFLFGESQQIEDAEGLAEEITAIFESDDAGEKMEVKKTPLKKALKELGADVDELDVHPDGLTLSVDNEEDYAKIVNIVTSPDNLYRFAELGWVAYVAGNTTVVQEPDKYTIKFLEIHTAGEEVEKEDLEKIVKNAQELGDSSEGSSQEDEAELNKEHKVKTEESAEDVVNKMLNEEYVVENKNSDVIDMFLRDSFPKNKRPVWGTTNVKISKEEGGWSLVNYYTRLLFRKEGESDVYFNTQKYSMTTTRIQNYIKSEAASIGVTLIPVTHTEIDSWARCVGEEKAADWNYRSEPAPGHEEVNSTVAKGEEESVEPVYTDLNALLEKYSKK